jgi:hypothetical protein
MTQKPLLAEFIDSQALEEQRKSDSAKEEMKDEDEE